MTRANSVWIAPSATAFSCLCETCLERARYEGRPFIEAVRSANVRGSLPTESDVGFAHCSSGHEVIVRRIVRPHLLPRRDARQLQLV
jgi:hypothetical protein